MIQRFKETSHLVFKLFKCINALSRGILKQRKGKNTIHFNGDSTNTGLLFQIIISVNQLSTYGAVTHWCEQFGLTEEEKGRANFLCGHQDVDKFTTRRSTTLGISSDNGTWKQDARKSSELGSTGDQRCLNMCEFLRSQTFGFPSKTCIWKQLARKHS